MPVTAATYQMLIVAELGTVDPTLQITAPDLAAVQAAWDIYADRDLADPNTKERGPYLQYLYTKRHLINVWMETAWQDIDTTDAGFQQAQSQRQKALDGLAGEKGSITAEIMAIEKRGMAGRVGVVGLIAPTTPETAPGGAFDAEDHRYRGSPYWPVYSPGTRRY